MDTKEIQSHLSGLEGFRGVFASDRIPKLKLMGRPQALVLNLDPQHLPGSHWVAAVIFRNKQQKYLQFFDSYGLKPPLKSVPRDWLVFHNPWRFQSAKSTVCGHYCIYFVRQRLLGESFQGIIQNLKGKNNPDEYVRKYVTRIGCCREIRNAFNNVPNQSCTACPGKAKLCKQAIRKICIWNLKKWTNTSGQTIVKIRKK